MTRQPQDTPLASQVVVFTGKLSSLGRKEAQALVIRLGGSAADEVTAKTTLVVIGAEGGASTEKSQKQRKAEDLGVRVVVRTNSAGSQAFSRPRISSSSTTVSAICSSMYPGLREDHLRYLQKWGLIRPVMRTHTETYYPFSDLLIIRHLSSELASAPFRTILRSLQAERSGQLTFDFRIDAEPARIIKLKRPKAERDRKGARERDGRADGRSADACRGVLYEGIGARRGRVPP